MTSQLEMMPDEGKQDSPRDFTSQDLLSATVEDIQNQPFSSRCKAECDELLRRLNEADALRKENTSLRGDNADLLAKQDTFVFIHNNMASDMDTLRKENEELRKDKDRIDFLDDGNYGIDPRNIPGVMMNGRRFHCLAGRGDWSSLRDAIDAARLANADNHEPLLQTAKE